MNSDKDQDILDVSNFKTKNEKLAWNRKYKKMQVLLEKVAPFEDKILELILQKQEFMDEIQNIRAIMVKECVHPKDMLVHNETHILCKFCNVKIRLNNGG